MAEAGGSGVLSCGSLQPLLLKRQQELEEAQAFNNWLGERRLAQEGQRRLDDVSRLTGPCTARFLSCAGPHRCGQAGRQSPKVADAAGQPAVPAQPYEGSLHFLLVLAGTYDDTGAKRSGKLRSCNELSLDCD